jgi:hypothetical protein
MVAVTVAVAQAAAAGNSQFGKTKTLASARVFVLCRQKIFISQQERSIASK